MKRSTWILTFSICFLIKEDCLAQKRSRYKAFNEVFISANASSTEGVVVGLGYERDFWRFSKGKQSISGQIEYSYAYSDFQRPHFLFFSPKYNLAFRRTTLSFYPSIGKELRTTQTCQQDNLPVFALSFSPKWEIRPLKMTVSGLLSRQFLREGGYVIPPYPHTVQYAHTFYPPGACVPYEWWANWRIGIQVGKYF
jgi:hypothetical protein